MSSSVQIAQEPNISELETRLAEAERLLANVRAEYAQFAYIVSHDLSAPMRHIDGFTSLLIKENETGLSEKSQEYLSYLRTSADNAAAIMSGLLEYSRLDTRQSAIEVVDCNDVLAEAKYKLGHLQRSQSASVVAANLPTLKADRSHLEKLFFHILQNALLYHAPNSSPHIQIECRNTQSHFEFCFKDNGIGIKDSLQRDVFDVLRRAVPTADYPGLGMGLAISSKIVQRHGGSISIDSMLGRGTSVYFTISNSL